jgi:beta-1,2-mannosidase
MLSHRSVAKTPNPHSILLLLLLLSACTGGRNFSTDDSWALQPIVKLDYANPIMEPDGRAEFVCPVRGEKVRWEEKDVFNPAGVVKDGRVWLLYRGEDKMGKFNGTSRIGLANSRDGIEFKKVPTPVLYPDNDPMKTFEWEGGCEDPRVVVREDGLFVMTYTAYDGDKARLCVASSKDLYTWTKHGLAFSDKQFRDRWTKSGAIVCERKKDAVVATRIRNQYVMYFGDTDIFMATSDDLIVWKPVVDKKGQFVPVMRPRPGYFDSKLVEPGPFALLGQNGILLLYNSANSDKNGDPSRPAGTYSVGQALFSAKQPQKLMGRSRRSFLQPDKPYELTGQVNNVCFLEGMVWFKDRWLLYYGTADSKIAVAEVK